MSRSLKKGPYVDPNVKKKMNKVDNDEMDEPIRTWARDCMITPEMVGYTFEVHNGREFKEVFIDEKKVGHRLGEFSKTRTFIEHGGQKAAEEEEEELF
ncbi:MAG: 30S ribosomal protein S19 [Candidatus Magasanikbacteria bacterium]